MEKTPQGVKMINEKVLQVGRAIITTDPDPDGYEWTDIPNGSLYVHPKTGIISVKLEGESSWSLLPDLIKKDGTFIISRDCKVVKEIFTVKEIDEENNTFIYCNVNDENRHSQIKTNDEGQTFFVFELDEGSYMPSRNLIEITINDVLTRSSASGGLIELTTKKIGLTDKLKVGDEITVKYMMRINIGNPYPRMYLSKTAPENAETGDFWLDLNSSPHNK